MDSHAFGDYYIMYRRENLNPIYSFFQALSSYIADYFHRLFCYGRRKVKSLDNEQKEKLERNVGDNFDITYAPGTIYFKPRTLEGRV